MPNGNIVGTLITSGGTGKNIAGKLSALGERFKKRMSPEKLSNVKNEPSLSLQ
jgi:hypothetical protein